MNAADFIARNELGNAIQQTAAICARHNLMDAIVKIKREALEDGIPARDINKGIIRMTFAMLTAGYPDMAKADQPQFAEAFTDLIIEEAMQMVLILATQEKR